MSAFTLPDNQDTYDYAYTEPDPVTTTPPLAQEQSVSPDANGPHRRGQSNNPLLGNGKPLVSELEQEVLDEYSRLLRNVNLVRRTSQTSCLVLPPNCTKRVPIVFRLFNLLRTWVTTINLQFLAL